MGVDGGRPGIEAPVEQVLADLHDLVLEKVRDPGRCLLGPLGAGLEPGFPFGPEAGNELVEPTAVHAVLGGQLGHRAPFLQVRLDQVTAQIHRRTPRFGVSYVLTQMSLMS